MAANDKAKQREYQERYYGPTRNAMNGRTRYADWEIELIMNPGKLSDKELAAKLSRSLCAIHIKRSNVRKARLGVGKPA